METLGCQCGSAGFQGGLRMAAGRPSSYLPGRPGAACPAGLWTSELDWTLCSLVGTFVD